MMENLHPYILLPSFRILNFIPFCFMPLLTKLSFFSSYYLYDPQSCKEICCYNVMKYAELIAYSMFLGTFADYNSFFFFLRS